LIPDENTKTDAELYIQQLSASITWLFIRKIKKKLHLACIVITVIDLVQYWSGGHWTQRNLWIRISVRCYYFVVSMVQNKNSGPLI